MKKVVSLMLSMVLVLGMVLVPAGAYSDVEEGRIGEAIERLSKLGILMGYEDGTFRPENNITRAEFVAVMNRALGLDSLVSGPTADAPFIDVPGTHWAAGDIKYAADNRMVEGYGSGYFGPEDNVTYEQAFKIIYNAMGYAPMAATMGEYPNNYLTMAAQDGIIKGLSISSYADPATRGNICSILYEAMQVETMEPTNFGGESTGYQKSGTTLLEKLLKLKNEALLEGIVTENHLTSLTGETRLEEGQVMITGLKDNVEQRYLVGETNAADLIGQRVEFHVNMDESLAYPELTAITPKRNTVLEIEAEDITNTTANSNGFTVEYEYEEGKNRKANVDAQVLYNGRALVGATAEDLMIKNGKMELIDNNQDSRYEVAMLSEYYSYRVDRVSALTSVIFLKDETFQGMNRISLEPDDDEFYYSIVDEEGKALEVEDVKEDDVVTVMADKDGKNIDLQICRKQVEGQAESYDEDEITIAGETYKLARNENGNVMVEADLSKAGTYYLDVYGQVVSFEEGETLIENVGYLAGVNYEGGFDDGLAMKVLLGGTAKQEQDRNEKYYYTTGNKEFKVLYSNGKVRFNGKSIGDEELSKELEPGVLINFGTNNEGKVTKIDVLEPEATEVEYSFNPEIGAFGSNSGSFYIDDKTVVVSVPKEETDDDDDYFVKVKLNTEKYLAQGFEIDEKTQKAKYVVVKPDMKADIGGILTDDTEIMVVTKVYEKAYETDEIYCVLEGYQNGKELSLQVSSDADVYTKVKKLKAGDVIYYSLNSRELVDNIEKVESLMPKPEYFNKNPHGKEEVVFGKLYKIVRDSLMASAQQQSAFEINLAASEDATVETVLITEETKNMPSIYQLDSRNGKVTVITLDELFSTDEVGYEKATELFICKKDGIVKGIVAVK